MMSRRKGVEAIFSLKDLSASCRSVIMADSSGQTGAKIRRSPPPKEATRRSSWA
jgi:hypothetical protein